MKMLNTMLAAGALAVSAGAASATTYYATSIEADYGICSGTVTQCSADDRLTETNALGAPDGSFYSLGHGGWAILGFAKSMFQAGTVSAFEITFNRLIGHNEAVRIETLDADKNVVEVLGNLLNNPGTDTFLASLPFSYIKLTDITWDIFGVNGTSSFDGFDVDSVGVAPVPLPAAGLMLLAGLGGFAAVRRRKAV